MPIEAETVRTPPASTSDQAWEHIRAALRDLRYGQVVVVVQDGVIVQIDRLERRRLTTSWSSVRQTAMPKVDLKAVVALLLFAIVIAWALYKDAQLQRERASHPREVLSDM
jgi:hypothetical protein